MLWVKMLHILGVMAWMASVFYLPRLLVNLTEAHHGREPTGRLEGMALRLFRFGLILATFAFVFGGLLWWMQGYTGDWIFWKLALVTVLTLYYFLAGYYVFQMRRGVYVHKGVFFRIFNEVSLLLTVGILIFAVLKIG